MNTLLTHGSSDARHAEQVRRLAANVSDRLGEQVGCAFLSDKTLPKGAWVLPLFLGHGRHEMIDAPALAARSGAVLLPSLAHHADLIAALVCDRVVQQSRPDNVLFGIYRYNGFEALRSVLTRLHPGSARTGIGALHAEPSIRDRLDSWREENIGSIILQPMLLFDGNSVDEMAEQAAGEDVEMLPVLSQGDDFAGLIASLMKPV